MLVDTFIYINKEDRCETNKKDVSQNLTCSSIGRDCFVELDRSF
jgi:hypothetical protein